MERTLEADLGQLLLSVSQRREAGQQVLAATLKLQLIRDTEGQFNERIHGFTSFKDFLEHAEQLKLIRVVRNGTNLEIYLPGETIGPTVRRLRRDLWAAFVDWDETKLRFWDKRTNRAYFEDERDEELLPGSVRERMRTAKDDFIRIRPISRDDQVSWMRDFSAHQREHINQYLSGALTNDLPTWAFAKAVKSVGSDVTAEWNRYLGERVWERVEAWLREHDPDYSYEESERSEKKEDPSDALRRHLHSAIDRMTPDEIRRIQLPVGDWLVGSERDPAAR